MHLTPVLWDELAAFGATLQRRLFHGGLPARCWRRKRPGLYRKWLASFFARDILQLFGFRDVNRFNATVEYLLRQSGGQFELTRTASALGIARPTVESHLRALEITHAITLVRPFHGGGQQELAKQPKVYGFDTGFVSFTRGWDPLRPADFGILWEHLVLESLQAYLPDYPVQYWHDRRGREIDFVIARNRDAIDVFECKWDATRFDGASLAVFREYYPRGRNYLVTPTARPAYTIRSGEHEVLVCAPGEMG